MIVRAERSNDHRQKPGMKSVVICAVVCSGAIGSLRAQTTQEPDPKQFFEMRIRPLLAKNCFPCHGDSRLGGLRLDTREGLMKGGDVGPVIVPWHPKSSLLIQAVSRTHERFKMP